MAQCLRALAMLAEDLRSVLRTHMVTHNCNSSFGRSNDSGLYGH
ncbi:mCG1033961 [Mus musculus]|nr:mCG1033961 [Mus musculus]